MASPFKKNQKKAAAARPAAAQGRPTAKPATAKPEAIAMASVGEGLRSTRAWVAGRPWNIVEANVKEASPTAKAPARETVMAKMPYAAASMSAAQTASRPTARGVAYSEGGKQKIAVNPALIAKTREHNKNIFSAPVAKSLEKSTVPPGAKAPGALVNYAGFTTGAHEPGHSFDNILGKAASRHVLGYLDKAGRTDATMAEYRKLFGDAYKTRDEVAREVHAGLAEIRAARGFDPKKATTEKDFSGELPDRLKATGLTPAQLSDLNNTTASAASAGDERAAMAAEGAGETEGGTIEPAEPREPREPAQASGPRIVINPSTFKNKKDALCVAFNERFRIAMEQYGFEPRSEPTPAQRRFFADTAYADDEVQLRRTILARILTLDTSVKDPTQEQIGESLDFLGMFKERERPTNDWEASALDRLEKLVTAAVKAEPREQETQEEEADVQ